MSASSNSLRVRFSTEAQLDRFLLHVVLDHPDAKAEADILDLVEGEGAGGTPGLDTPLTADTIIAAREAAMAVHLSPVLKDYIVRLVTATRADSDATEIAGLIEHPASSRASIALAAASKALAFLRGRDYAVPEDVQELAADALAHRIVLKWRATAEGETPRSVIGKLLETVRSV